MKFKTIIPKLLNRKGLRFLLVTWLNYRARSQNKLFLAFYDGDWVYQTTDAFFVQIKPNVDFDTSEFNALPRFHFLWGYKPQKGDVVIDIGAGIGEEAFIFSKEVGEQGKVICLEAQPRTYRCLEKLVKYNNLKNVITIQEAIADVPSSSTTITDSDGHYFSNSILSSTGIVVKATTVDEIYNRLGLGRINFLKMNIEGAERLAIKGITETLKHTEIICISCHDFMVESTRDNFYSTKTLIKEFLLQRGLKLVERTERGVPYLSDQVWAYNESLKPQ